MPTHKERLLLEYNGEMVRPMNIPISDLILIYVRVGGTLSLEGSQIEGEFGRRKLSHGDIIEYVRQHPELGIEVNLISQI